MAKFILCTGTAVIIALLTGCASTPKPAADVSVLPPPPAIKLSGLSQIMGRSAAALVQLFGAPDQDLREANGRRLQFSSVDCVLDAYLYATDKSHDALVTYVEARKANGLETDRATCLSAILKSRGR